MPIDDSGERPLSWNEFWKRWQALDYEHGKWLGLTAEADARKVYDEYLGGCKHRKVKAQEGALCAEQAEARQDMLEAKASRQPREVGTILGPRGPAGPAPATAAAQASN